jgi:hypothetical protein
MMNSNIRTWLYTRYKRAEDYQTENGIHFDLTFEEYLSLWSPYRLLKLEEYLRNNEIDRRMRHPLYGWVLSWISKDARKTGVMNKDTARLLNRDDSEKRFFMQRGERHTEEAKAAIGAAHRGKSISQEHREKISAARKGTKQTEEHKRKRIEAARATRERKLAEAEHRVS